MKALVDILVFSAVTTDTFAVNASEERPCLLNTNLTLAEYLVSTGSAEYTTVADPTARCTHCKQVSAVNQKENTSNND